MPRMARSMSGMLLCAAALLLLLLAGPSSALADSSAVGAVLPVSYFVLIDAGSTGSRAHVHEYRVDPSRPLPLVEESKNLKLKPGLSSYAKKPQDATESIQALLTFIKSVVPQEQWAKTPIQVHATAGLRSVTPAEANEVLEVVRDELARSDFLFERHWARVISGEQEGINGWMAVNYLLGVFDKPAPKDGKPPASTGVVEMGGSSMQITFSPLNPSEDDRKQLNEVRVAGHTYWLYTHSFLQYGLQAAEKLYQKLAIAEIEEKGNPCYPPNFRHSSVGDFDRCTSSLSDVVDKSVACAAKHCSFNGVYQPAITNEQFLAIENFYYTAKFFGTAEEQDAPPAIAAAGSAALSVASPPTGNQVIPGLRRKGKEFCNRDWEQLREQYATTAADELKAFCFSAAYQTVVLESGLGFTPETNLRVAKKIGGKGIDWEMGAVLFELMPKDPAVLAAQKAEEDARLHRARAVVFDDAEGMQRMTAVNMNALPSQHTGGICQQCLLYTVLVAAVVVMGYFAYRRYYRTKGLTHSYSQAGFNRV